MGKIDLTGQRFGRLVVLYENGRNKHGKVLWLCKCDCGNEVTVVGSSLRAKCTTSCGCYDRDRKTTHGMTKTRLYRTWENMLERAGARKGASEKTKRAYIDRGIAVCEEWLIFENFRDWALSNGYSDDLELDRFDNDRGYCPENCRWVSRRENTNNRRNTLRLADGTSLALFCSKVGVQTTCENGRQSKQYARILARYRRGKIHPELLSIANDYLNLLRKLKASLDLLSDVRKFREKCNASQMEVATCPESSVLPIREYL